MTYNLYRGDCLELMKDIPDGSIDMILCDLPYGTTQNKWDTCIPFSQLWEQYHRICKKHSAILLFGQMPFSAALVMSNPKEFRYEWIYEKTNSSGFLNANKMPMRCHENILVFYRSITSYTPQFTYDGNIYNNKKVGKRHSNNYGDYELHKNYKSTDGKRYPRDVIKISNPSWGPDKGLHPTQKPVALLEYLIKTYTNEGETVLDNCMGSGSTGVACINTNRNFIGIELDEGYFDIATKRIQQAYIDKYQN